MKTLYLAIPLVCLLASVVAGLLGKKIGRAGAHTVTIGGVSAALVMSLIVYFDVRAGNTFNGSVYTWSIRKPISMLTPPLIAQV